MSSRDLIEIIRKLLYNPSCMLFTSRNILSFDQSLSSAPSRHLISPLSPKPMSAKRSVALPDSRAISVDLLVATTAGTERRKRSA